MPQCQIARVSPVVSVLQVAKDLYSLYTYQIQNLGFGLNLTSCNPDGKYGSAVLQVALHSLLRWLIVGYRQAFVALFQITRITGGSREIPNSVVIVLAGETLVLNER